MNKIFSIIFVSIIVLGSGCGSQATIKKLNDSSVVVSFGDSITSGTGAPRTESYPAVLSDLIQCKVVNAGVPGEDTTAGLRRLPGVLKKYNPDLVILCHGGNDMLSKQKKDITISNLDSMVSMVKSFGADVVLVGVPKPALLLKTHPLYKETAGKHRIPLVFDALAEVLSNPALKSDRVHPNGKGYRVIAESIAVLIRERQK